MTSILRHVAEAFPPAMQGAILNSHLVISIATNTSRVLNCTLVTYIMMTADEGLPDAVYRHIPGHHATSCNIMQHHAPSCNIMQHHALAHLYLFIQCFHKLP